MPTLNETRQAEALVIMAAPTTGSWNGDIMAAAAIHKTVPVTDFSGMMSLYGGMQNFMLNGFV